MKLSEMGNDNIFVETLLPYLFFKSENIPDGYTHLKAYPPIRDTANFNYIWERLKISKNVIISSGHVEYSDEYKFASEGSFKKAVRGIHSLSHTLPAVWTAL
jgi:dihydroorotase-like cyclic amidohydrolase